MSAAASLGGTVVLLVSASGSRGETLAAELSACGAVPVGLCHEAGRAGWTTVALDELDAVRRAVRAAREEHGRLDAVVVDSRIDGGGSELVPDREQWERHHRSTVLSAVHVAYAFSEQDQPPRSVLFVLPSSVREAREGSPIAAALGTSVLGLAKHLAVEWRDRSIRVNTVIADDTENPAGTIAFLLSTESQGVSGAAVPVDAGRSRQLF